jgi:antitoxin MazE
MKAKLIKIGNSRGVRLPKALIEQAGLEEDVEMLLQGGEIVLRGAANPRAGWDEAFRKALAKGGAPVPDKDWLDAPLLGDTDLPPW